MSVSVGVLPAVEPRLDSHTTPSRFSVCVVCCVVFKTGTAGGRADAGRLQGQGRRHAVRPVHLADAVSEAHGSGRLDRWHRYYYCRVFFCRQRDEKKVKDRRARMDILTSSSYHMSTFVWMHAFMCMRAKTIWTSTFSPPARGKRASRVCVLCEILSAFACCVAGGKSAKAALCRLCCWGCSVSVLGLLCLVCCHLPPGVVVRRVLSCPPYVCRCPMSMSCVDALCPISGECAGAALRPALVGAHAEGQVAAGERQPKAQRNARTEQRGRCDRRRGRESGAGEQEQSCERLQSREEIGGGGEKTPENSWKKKKT